MKLLLVASILLASCVNVDTNDNLDKEIEESERLEQKYQSDIDSNNARYNSFQDSLNRIEIRKF